MCAVFILECFEMYRLCNIQNMLTLLFKPFDGELVLWKQTFVCKNFTIFLPIYFNLCFGCSKEPSRRDGSFEYPQHLFLLRNAKLNFLVCTLKLKCLNALSVKGISKHFCEIYWFLRSKASFFLLYRKRYLFSFKQCLQVAV